MTGRAGGAGGADGLGADASRTYSWVDPARFAAARAEITGRALLEGLRDGTIPHPPSCATLNFRVAEVEENTVTLTAEPGDHQYNAVGSVHGGIVSTWLDSAMGYAIQSTLEVGESFNTLDLTTRFMRAIRSDTGPVRAVGTVEHRGRTTATARGEIRDSDGRLLASGTTTGLILR